MAHTRPVQAFASTNTCIVLDDTGTNYRVRTYTTQGDLATLTPGSTKTFTDTEVANGMLWAYIRLLVPGLV